ncbi:MAG: hypothetical protein M1816_000855 [Peltula sp. TS41687]|nr:MAG: hypothetical protein M1816_000855 [Peltula sp. TS41687]
MTPVVQTNREIPETPPQGPVTPPKGPPSLSATSSSRSAAVSEPVELPPYLRRTKAEIRERFQDLEWRERERLLQSQQVAEKWAQEQNPEIKLRNRWLNVQPWARNRIHLKVPPEHNDYINASPIVLTSSNTAQEKKYIATQGPMQGQLNLFWRMIWDETSDPAVIVMLTQTAEGGREKCFQYFPASLEDDLLWITDGAPGEDEFFAIVQLLEIDEDTAAKCVIRKLRLEVGQESKIVWHLLFIGWRDFGIPEDEDRVALLELINLSAEKAGSGSDNRRVIHCSAGVGRSGTFIALDFLLQELIDDDSTDDNAETETDSDYDPIYETVNSLREQRMMMVQNEQQLQFIYEILKEKWLAKQADAHTDSPEIQQAILQEAENVERESSAQAKEKSERGEVSTVEG